ncbi:SRPBCC family protein [[Mycobacterium] wendilense]|uniref:SRPBCC family protein n=1 Tax=[Mycobacterium] wendilense TaxID=3064284 RepID=A0ABM9M950_9MYCO|nr:SRPBCC family protein [Mycolicibacterium sp. MU0050]CAJ1579472.1 SRPBCC family protein [Mycolicibacterium sp. MU0050]
MVDVHIERTIGAEPQRVFDWLADPASLTSAPLVLRAAWATTGTQPGVGALRKVLGTGMWFQEEITAYDPPHSYSYLIVRSFPAFDHDGGTLTFTPTGGGTHVDWSSSYTHPARGGGAAMEALTSRLLPWNFDAVLAGCAKALER